MDKREHSSSLLDRLLARLGGWYPMIVLLAIQLSASSLGLLLIAALSQMNAELSRQQTISILTAGFVSLLPRNIAILVLMYFTSRQMFDQLKKRGQASPPLSDLKEGLAWRQASSFGWRYTILTFVVSTLLVVPAASAYIYFTIGITQEQLIYVALAAIAVCLGFVVLENQVIKFLMGPVRKSLLSAQFEMQLNNLRGFSLLAKTLAITVTALIVGILLLAPIGYHQTVIALNGQTGSLPILKSLQLQLILTSIGILLFGFVLAYSLIHSVSTPIRHMLATFGKVEKGDLTQRIKIISTDEVGRLAIHFNFLLAKLGSLQASLEERVKERTKQLSDALEIGRAATAIQNQDELTAKMVNMIANRFEYDFVAIFLKDPTGLWAEFKDATGSAGQVLRQRGYKLVLGGKSAVSSAMTTSRPRIVRDFGAEAEHFDNPSVPGTRSEVVLPLKVGEQVIGALDIQSSQEDAFIDNNIDVLQRVADQLAIALENTRSFPEMWKVQQTEALDKNKRESLQTNPPSSTSPGLNVPLTMHLVEAVATQAALATENARLVQDAQQRAERERLMSQVATRMRETLDIDTILRTAVQELRRTFDLDEAEVRLQLAEPAKKSKRQRKS